MYQAPTNTQSVNPYSYVMNNSLSLVDPSGYAAAASPDGMTFAEKSGGPRGGALAYGSVTIDFGLGGSIGGEGGRDSDGNLIPRNIDDMNPGDAVVTADGHIDIKNDDGSFTQLDGNGATSGDTAPASTTGGGANSGASQSDSAAEGSQSATAAMPLAPSAPSSTTGGGASITPSQGGKTVQYSINLLGKSVPVSISGDDTSIDMVGRIASNLNAAVKVINDNSSKLNPYDIKTLQNIKSIEISENIPSSVNPKTGVFYLRGLDALGTSPAFLASDFFHEGEHVNQNRAGLIYTPNNAKLMEQMADSYQLGVGAKLGVSARELLDLLHDIQICTHTAYTSTCE